MDVNDQTEALDALPAKKGLGRASGNGKQSSITANFIGGITICWKRERKLNDTRQHICFITQSNYIGLHVSTINQSSSDPF